MSNTSQNIELLPCPFCKKQPCLTPQHTDSGVFIWCENCGARGPNFWLDWINREKLDERIDKKAVQAWNRRADDGEDD